MQAEREREREDFKDGKKETLPRKQQNKERTDSQDSDLEKRPDKQHRQKNKGSNISISNNAPSS